MELKSRSQRVPMIGSGYHFWRDGIPTENGHWTFKCKQLLKLEDAKVILISHPVINDNGEKVYQKDSLLTIWEEARKEQEELSDITDYIALCYSEEYTPNNTQFFARGKDTRWYMISISSPWDSGILDVGNELYHQYVMDNQPRSI